ncbi:hypothetical protein C2S52_019560 [Perilla frutescens var. hirtella]|uniref:Late embryogenesis abundant protein LEA-2 subgroup domain-containing protein n=1 Tax=Perilla frutescens var. hirtella TaxID=608512 RepID=A0AAD4JBM2_PERFH|nr:hypothetical protein C2S52_019560 [Perilla frutescens var. hirtella]KAH6802809.1 hypothetical protein C2S51_034255 [Perilla frutescens var. frutescens]KAH6806179.1 hypothetical protein C2S51_031010 [Perilla frutescens var. frutescens]KAH6830193.1 hypothetical protein C2S53_015576 [Perilla frutescens var. hirtella]
MVLLSTILTITLIIWFLFGAYLPEFEVASIKLSNFSATNTSLSGAWTVAMFVKNVNMELHVDFHHAMSSVFYRDSLLGIVALDPFHVPKTQRFALNFTVPALRNPDDQRLHSWVLPTLAEDRSDGAVVVSLRLAMDANFTAPDVVYRQESIRIYCEDLVIRFSPSTGEGTWSPGLGNPCFIRMRDSHD